MAEPVPESPRKRRPISVKIIDLLKFLALYSPPFIVAGVCFFYLFGFFHGTYQITRRVGNTFYYTGLPPNIAFLLTVIPSIIMFFVTVFIEIKIGDTLEYYLRRKIS